MTRQVMDERRFIYKDQERFARLSGDFNPMHMDPVFARRTMLGDVVVHGIHSLLWAMDSWCESQKELLQLICLIAAKAAGEYLVRFLEKVNPELRVHTPRLPRISTDQTSSIVPTRNEDAGVLVLPILQDMAATDIEISRGNAAND